MAAQPQAPLTAADLAEYRANLEAQRDLAKAAFLAGDVPSNLVCTREYNRGLETAYDYALAAFDDLTADVVTFVLVDPDEA